VQTCAPVTSSDSAVPPPSDPSSITPRHASVEALSHKSSWFASWTRTKVEWAHDASLEKTPHLTLAPGSGTGSSPPPILSTTGDPQPVTEGTPTSALPQNIPAKTQFRDLPAPSPRSVSYSSPPAHQSIPNYTSTPSPLHEDSLKLSPTKLPLVTSSTVLQSSEPSNSIPTPTNRFTLGIPLLGRAKVPIEKTVATAQCDDMSLPADQPPPSKQLLATQGLCPPDTISVTSDCIAR